MRTNYTAKWSSQPPLALFNYLFNFFRRKSSKNFSNVTGREGKGRGNPEKILLKFKKNLTFGDQKFAKTLFSALPTFSKSFSFPLPKNLFFY